MKKGLCISFEGPDGSGKTTQIKLLGEYLSDLGHEVVYTREPGGTRIGEKIRALILDVGNAEMSALAEMMLYAASRAQHIAEVIGPALEKGSTVLCDRYVDSSVVYQGYGRRLGRVVSEVNALAVGETVPDLTILLKIDPEACFDRIGRTGGDRIESEEMDYHRRVYSGYLELERKYPERVKGVDATGDVDDVCANVRRAVDGFLESYDSPDGGAADPPAQEGGAHVLE
jgi:dTMP kinase